jgi:hypothetical protein
MMIVHRSLITSVVVATLSMSAVDAAPAPDFTDQWWVAGESGWGAAILQQADTLFVNLLVHGADGKPTWYASAAFYDKGSLPGRPVYGGDLYLTNGTYYGGPWNPAAAGFRKVGTLTFDAISGNAAVLSYIVDGEHVAKDVSRQLWSYEDLGGTYDTIWKLRCGLGAFDWEVTRTTVAHVAGNAVVLSVSCPLCFSNFRHDLIGTYAQSGRLGKISAELVAPDGGAITISDIAHTNAGFTGRVDGTMTIGGNRCLITEGRIGAALR